MSKLLSLLSAVLVVGFAMPADAASKSRCKVQVGDNYYLIDRTFTEGGCRVKAKEYVGRFRCSPGQKKFEFKYMFDGKIERAERYCR